MILLTKSSMCLVAGALAVLTGIMAADGCDRGTPAPQPTASRIYIQDPMCFDERWPVDQVCTTVNPLPACPSEDDAVDGEPGEPCYWRDPSSGDLWFNDGDGVVLP